MIFETEQAAMEHWTALYSLYGIEPPTENYDISFWNWVDENNVSWLDDDLATFLKEER